MAYHPSLDVVQLEIYPLWRISIVSFWSHHWKAYETFHKECINLPFERKTYDLMQGTCKGPQKNLKFISLYSTLTEHKDFENHSLLRKTPPAFLEGTIPGIINNPCTLKLKSINSWIHICHLKKSLSPAPGSPNWTSRSLEDLKLKIFRSTQNQQLKSGHLKQMTFSKIWDQASKVNSCCVIFMFIS